MSDFWSRRKAAVEAEQRAEAEAAAAALRAEREARAAKKTDDELLEELGLPEPESLGAGDDFRPFLGEAIPARLRARALRRLWRVNPVLANVDGLVDYGEDFTDAATVIEGMQTAYQVGRGMLAHLDALSRERELAQAETDPQGTGEAPAPAAPAPAVPVIAAEDAPPRPDSALTTPMPPAPEPGAAPAIAEAEPEAEVAPARRRMTFVFQDQRTA